MPIGDPFSLSRRDSYSARAYNFQSAELIAICRAVLQSCAEQKDGGTTFRDPKLNDVLKAIRTALNSVIPEAQKAYQAAEKALLDYETSNSTILSADMKIANRMDLARGKDAEVIKGLTGTLQTRRLKKLEDRGTSVSVEVLLGYRNLTTEVQGSFIKLGSNMDMYSVLWLLCTKGIVSLDQKPHFYENLPETYYPENMSLDPLPFNKKVGELRQNKLIVLIDRNHHILIRSARGQRVYSNIWETSVDQIILKEIDGRLSAAEKVRKDLRLPPNVKATYADSDGREISVIWKQELSRIAGNPRSSVDCTIEPETPYELPLSPPQSPVSDEAVFAVQQLETVNPTDEISRLRLQSTASLLHLVTMSRPFQLTPTSAESSPFRLGTLSFTSPASEFGNSVLHPTIEDVVASWMPGGNDQEIVDRLDQMMMSGKTDPKEIRNYVRELMKICGRTGILPSSYMLNSGLSKLDDHYIAAGTFGEVWRGKYRGYLVAIKELRVHSVDNPERLKKDFCKEAVLWKRLSHINIVPFLGVSTEFNKLCMVSGWMPNGNLRRYVWNNMECDRIPLLWDVTSGLSYLHYMNVIHADLKGDNILINDEGRACLCDFGLASMKVSAGTVASTKIGEGTARWMAPELFDLMDENDDEDVVATQQSPRPTASSDVYALCMVFLEIFTGKLPFANVREEAVILWASRGKKPDRPVDSAAPGLTSEMWLIMQAGWRKADERPTVQSILDALPVPLR